MSAFSSAVSSFRITFQPAACGDFPKGYLLDAGKPFHPRKGYGWSPAAAQHARDRRVPRRGRPRLPHPARTYDSVDACLCHLAPGTTWTADLNACLLAAAGPRNRTAASKAAAQGGSAWEVTFRFGDLAFPSVVSASLGTGLGQLMGVKLAAKQFYNWRVQLPAHVQTITLTAPLPPDAAKKMWPRIVSVRARLVEATSAAAAAAAAAAGGKRDGAAAPGGRRQLSDEGADLFRACLRTASSVRDQEKEAYVSGGGLRGSSGRRGGNGLGRTAGGGKNKGSVQITNTSRRQFVHGVEDEEAQAEVRATLLRLKYAWARAGRKARAKADGAGLPRTSSSSSSAAGGRFGRFGRPGAGRRPPPVNTASIKEIQAMGFPRNHAVLALRAKGGDVARSIDWLLSGGGGNLPPPDDSDPSAAAGGGGRGGSSSVRVARGVGARKAKPRPGRSVPLAGTARSVSGSEYQACASEEGAKHHADHPSRVQVLPDILLRPGALMVGTHTREATQTLEQRSLLDAGCPALTLRVRRPCHLFVAVDRRLAAAGAVPKWLMDRRMYQPMPEDVVSVSDSDAGYFVLFCRTVSTPGEVQLGPSGVPGAGFLPQFFFLTEIDGASAGGSRADGVEGKRGDQRRRRGGSRK